ncbi:MAG TPA: hypothetical protein VFM82_08765, partial [Flavobacteriaceae bacterium]|nr:hypothetical protein [Flavobacteriaceae bacterium]
MKFQSRKDVLTPLIVFGFTGLLLWMGGDFLIASNSETEDFFSLLPLFMVTILLWWIYFGTNYELNENELHYKSGPLRGTIKIDQI